MRKNIYIVLLALLSMMVLDVQAASRDVAAARDIALLELNRPRPGRQQPPVTDVRLAHVERLATSSATGYYIFNATDGSSFVIVSGDDWAEAVLGYGEGQLDAATMPCSLQWLLSEYRQQMEWLQAHPDAQVNRAAPVHAAVVTPLLTSTWGQESPYNDLCPTIDGQHCVTGCVATAMAQVMNYWKFPLVAPALEGYSTNTNHISVPPLPATAIDWNNMLDSYRVGSYNDAQAAAVATLMRYCGQSAGMDYGVASSGSWNKNALVGFQKLRFNHDATHVSRYDYSDDDWLSMLLNELANDRPVFYIGYGDKGSHAFVIDGFDGEKYHINWGWNSLANGYFAMGAFNAGGYKLNEGHQMILNLYPEAVDYLCDFSVDGIYYVRTSQNTVSVTCADAEFNSYSGEVNIPPLIVYMGNTFQVTGIAGNAFRQSLDLTAVTIPTTVTSIGKKAFWGCKSLTDVSIPASVEQIDDEAFLGCISMTSVTLPPHLTDLNSGVFGDCVRLTDVSLPQGLATIGESAFKGCVKLPGLTIPATVNRIGPEAFKGCTGLQGISLPEGLTTLSGRLFMDCTGLMSVSIPANVSIIGESVFENCSALTTVMIPATVTGIGMNAFKNCSGLSRVMFAAAVSMVEVGAFEGCTAIKQVEVPDVATWCGMNFRDKMYSNPIAHSRCLYAGGSRLQDLVVPEGVTSIGDYTFSHDTAIVSLKLPRSLVKVGSSALQCVNLSRVDVPDVSSWCGINFVDSDANPLNITQNIFFDGQQVMDLEVPEGVISIGDYAFENARFLRTLSLPSTISSLGLRAFNGTTLTEVICRAPSPPAVKGSDAFSAADYAGTILRVPSTSCEAYKNHAAWGKFTTVLPMLAGFEQGGLIYAPLDGNRVQVSYAKTSTAGDVVIPQSITHDGSQYTVAAIATGAFYGINGITGVDIPSTVKSIGEDAFKGCTGLKWVNIHDLAVWCGVEFGNADANPVSLAHHLKLNGQPIQRLTIPDGVTAIKDNAFNGCTDMTDLIISRHVNSIGSQAFAGTNLGNLICMAADPPQVADKDAFSDKDYMNAVLRIRGATASEYANHDIWQNFVKREVLDCDFEQNGMLYFYQEDGSLMLSSAIMASLDSVVVIPQTVVYNGTQYTITAIGRAAFKNRGDIVEVDIPKTVTAIGWEAFAGCTSLKRVNIHDLGAWCRIVYPMNPNGIYYSGISNPLYYAHRLYLDGQLLTDVRIPDDVTAINDYAFVNCYSIKRFDTGNGVKSIGYAAFEYSQLDSLALGKSVERIGEKAFNNVQSMRQVYMHGAVRSIGADAFKENYKIVKLEVDDPVAWLSIEFANEDANPLSGSNAKMYHRGERIITMVIPDTVEVIKDYAYSGGAGFRGLVIPSSVKSIGADAFISNYTIDSVFIDDLATWCQIKFATKYSSPFMSIGEYAQYFGDFQPKLYIKGELAQDIEMPATVTEIGNYAFAGCLSLGKVKLNNVRSIGNWAFYSSSVTSVEGTSSLRSIGNYAFDYCRSLTTAVLPNTVTTISDYAFLWCDHLESVTIPKSLKRLNTCVFAACMSLKSATVPDGVTFIANGAFDNNYRLKNVVIGASVDTIQALGNSAAFGYCDSLETVTCKAPLPPVLQRNAFIGKAYQNATLYVPVESVEAYRQADEWKRFARIEGVEVQVELPGDVNADGSVNIADVNAIIQAILDGNAHAAADVNEDGSVNITDVNTVINLIMDN